MSPSLVGLAARAAEYRRIRQIKRDSEVERDRLIAKLWADGWSQARIAGHIGMVEVTIGRRLKALGLSRPCGFRRWHAGLSEAEMEHYRALAGNSWTAAEARAAVLEARREAA